VIEIRDQLGNQISLSAKPERIVSIVPSQTELLHYLGLEEEVVGITKFCVHPKEWFDHKARVGGTKTLDLEKIHALQPDLIVANKEENNKEDIERLQQSFPVYLSDIYTIEDSLEMIHSIGVLTDRLKIALELINDLNHSFTSFPSIKGRTLYFMWNNPYMVAGRNTFIGNVMERLGLENCFSEQNGRYREISVGEIKSLKPDFIFLSTEPFPFKEEQAVALRENCDARVVIVDGEIFSWYGSRMLQMTDYFRGLLSTFP
jgi:ABC-type Fe3+-hydroxamate transport system substrate-binding protein